MPLAPQWEARLRRLTLALVAGLFLGLAIYLAVGERQESSFLRGDFPAFYAAAELVWSGRGSDLYDYTLQRDIENRYWPDFAGGFYIYAYPPFFALLLSPLAALPPLVAKALASGVLMGAFVATMVLARRSSPFLRAHFGFSLLFLLSFAPLQIAIIGVQNTALSMLLFALVLWAINRGYGLLPGVGTALLLYKPQFGVLFLPYLLVRGNRGDWLGWAFGAMVLYLLGALVQGPCWPLIWFKAATHFGNLNFTINDHNMSSLAGLFYWTFERLGGEGAVGLPWAYLTSGILLVVTLAYLRQDPKRLALAPALVLLLSPQTLFYDVAIALFFYMMSLEPDKPRNFLVLALIWGYGLGALLLREQVSFPLSSLLLLAIIGLQIGQLHRSPGRH